MPAWSMGSQQKGYKPKMTADTTPGPGTYTNGPRSSEKLHNVRFGNEKRLDILKEKNKVPGPGT
jgi:hypothetical protein